VRNEGNRCLETARGEGERVKPGVERSGTPGQAHRKELEPAKWAAEFGGCEKAATGVARFTGSKLIHVCNLGFRFAPPQALRCHPLRGFEESIECLLQVKPTPSSVRGRGRAVRQAARVLHRADAPGARRWHSWPVRLQSQPAVARAQQSRPQAPATLSVL
jgi:hypothetical protein